jgi:SOS-response transcriptional repressor LexA
MPAKPLSEEQLDDAKRLSAIFVRKKKKDSDLTQESLAHACGWKTQGTVNQYLNGKIPLNLPALLKFSQALKVAPSEISPTLSNQLTIGDPTQASVQAGGDSRALLFFDTLKSDAVESDLFGGSHVVITNATASMGAGLPQVDHEQAVSFIQVAKSWVHGNLPANTSVDKLAILTAYGDSMSPTFSDGDLLLVDRGVKEIKLDAVYVISRDNELFIKRVRRRVQDGAVIIKSDNPLYGTGDIIENGEREQLEILGRVVWAWSGKKL